MRILALDVGTKTIGMAISDELGITSNPLATIRRKSRSRDLELLSDIVSKEKPSLILVGIPYQEDGTLTPRGKSILKFGEELGEELDISIELWDESFSTVEAKSLLLKAEVSRKKRKRVIDQSAAAVILSEYLNHLNDISGKKSDKAPQET